MFHRLKSSFIQAGTSQKKETTFYKKKTFTDSLHLVFNMNVEDNLLHQHDRPASRVL